MSQLDYATPHAGRLPRRLKWTLLAVIAALGLALAFAVGYQAGVQRVEETDRAAFRAMETQIRAFEARK